MGISIFILFTRVHFTFSLQFVAQKLEEEFEERFSSNGVSISRCTGSKRGYTLDTFPGCYLLNLDFG